MVCDWLAGRGVRELVWQWPLPVEPEAIALADDGASLDGIVIGWCGATQSLRPMAQVLSHPFAPTYGRLSPGSLLVVRYSAKLPTALVTRFASVPDLCRRVAADERRLILSVPLAAGTHELEFRAYDRPLVRRAAPPSPSREAHPVGARPLSPV